MILISKGENKKIYFTVNPTLNPVYYLFEFVSNNTGNKTYMMADDISTNSSVYKTFLFQEGSTQSMSGGFIVNPGTYDYNLYQTGTQSLNPLLATSILEIGLMTVMGNDMCYTPDIDEGYVYYDECSGPSVYGITGATGPSGSSGTSGMSGSSGSSGTSGVSGSSGSSGTSGSSGITPTLDKLGKVHFVSIEGNDSTAEKGNILKPYLTIMAARDAALSGDLVYVMPGQYTFTNVATLAGNLWKSGIEYYFEQGSIIDLSNSTSSSRVSLFEPTGPNETCKVTGYLTLNIIGGPPNQRNYLYYAPASMTGTTFVAEMDKVTMVLSNEIILTETSIVHLKIREFIQSYGFRGSGADFEVNTYAGSDVLIEIEKYTNNIGFGPRVNLRGDINLRGDGLVTFNIGKLYNWSGNEFLYIRGGNQTGCKNINLNIDEVVVTNGSIVRAYFNQIDTILNVKLGKVTPGAVGSYLINIENTGNIVVNLTANIENWPNSIVRNWGTIPTTINVINSRINCNNSQYLFSQQAGTVNIINTHITGTYQVVTYVGPNSIQNINNCTFINNLETSVIPELFRSDSIAAGQLNISNTKIDIKNKSLMTNNYTKLLVENTSVKNTLLPIMNGVTFTTNNSSYKTDNINTFVNCNITSSNSSVNKPYTNELIKGDMSIIDDFNSILSTNNVKVDGYVEFDVNNTLEASIGQLVWDDLDGTLSLGLESDSIIKIGQHNVIYVKFNESVAKGDAIQFKQTQGSYLIVEKVTSSIQSNPELFIGLSKNDYSTNDFGYVVVFGKINKVDTSMFAVNDILYVVPTGLTTTRPTTGSVITTAVVIVSSSRQGVLLIRPTIDYLNDMLPINISNAQLNQSLLYNTTTNKWENKWTFFQYLSGWSVKPTLVSDVSGVKIFEYQFSFGTIYRRIEKLLNKDEFWGDIGCTTDFIIKKEL